MQDGLEKIILTPEAFESLTPPKREEVTCSDCGEKYKFFHKCEKFVRRNL